MLCCARRLYYNERLQQQQQQQQQANESTARPPATTVPENANAQSVGFTGCCSDDLKPSVNAAAAVAAASTRLKFEPQASAAAAAAAAAAAGTWPVSVGVGPFASAPSAASYWPPAPASASAIPPLLTAAAASDAFKPGLALAQQPLPLSMPVPLAPPKRVKKPLNAFMIFMREQRPIVMRESNLKESAAINQLLGTCTCSPRAPVSCPEALPSFSFPFQSSLARHSPTAKLQYHIQFNPINPTESHLRSQPVWLLAFSLILYILSQLSLTLPVAHYI